MRIRSRTIGYSTAWWDEKHRRWKMLGDGKIRYSREGAEYETGRWRAYQSVLDGTYRYADARTVQLVEPRWTLRDVYNQIVVWLSWVRS